MLMCRRVFLESQLEATHDVLGRLCRSRWVSRITGILIDAIGVQLVSHIVLPRQSA